MAGADRAMRALRPAELDWLTADELAEHARLVTLLPRAGDEQRAARARVAEKRALRLAAQEGFITPPRAFEIGHALALYLNSGVLPAGAAVTIDIPIRMHEEGLVRIVVHAKMLHPRTGECVAFRVPGEFPFLDPTRAIRRAGAEVVKKLQTVR